MNLPIVNKINQLLDLKIELNDLQKEFNKLNLQYDVENEYKATARKISLKEDKILHVSGELNVFFDSYINKD